MTKRKDETKEDYLLRKRLYNWLHREQRIEYCRQYRTVHVAALKAYRDANRDAIREKNRAYYKMHYEERYAYRRRAESRFRESANQAVAHAIRGGRLQPPDRCQRCDCTPPPTFAGARGIQAHHFRGYAPEHWLDVEWLCRDCHAITDRLWVGGIVQ